MKPAPLTRIYATLLAALLLGTAAVAVRGGNLNPPPGPVSPTMKALDIVEPRTPISSLPFTISSPGSYYVTKDLTGTAGNNGITIAASDVHLDLMGFTLRGVSGSLHGIASSGPQIKISIVRGKVCGWGGAGIYLGGTQKCMMMTVQADDDECGVVTGTDTDTMCVVATSNRSDGIVTSSRCSAEEDLASGNGGDGIRMGAFCTITRCGSSDNDGNGLVAGDGSTLASCTAGSNGGIGIMTVAGAAARGSTLTSCTASSNVGGGIAAAAGSTLKNCASTGNSGDGIVIGTGSSVSSCIARGNFGDGIRCGANALILQNDCTENGAGAGDGAGIHVTAVGGGTRIEANNVVSNDRGIDIDSPGNLVIKNSASGTGVPFDIAPNNSVGTILSVVGNGNFSTTNCFANLIY